MKYINIKNTMLILLLLLAAKGLAQQDVMFTQYMNNPVAVNPGYAGSRDAINFTSLYRHQWAGISGAPRTATFSINTPIPMYKFALGLDVITDKVGPVTQTSLFVNYAYHLQVFENWKLGLGLKGGTNFYDKTLSESMTNDPDGHIASNGVANEVLPNFGAGLYLYSDNYYFGLSVPKLVTYDLEELGTASDTEFNGDRRHFFLMAGAMFTFTDDVRFRTSMSARVVDGAPLSADISPMVLLYDKIWIGGMWRFGDAIGAIAQFNISPQFKLGYSYDWSYTMLNNYNNGSHELFISYDISFGNKKIVSPRYF